MVAEADVDRTLESDGSHLAGTLKFIDSNASTAQRTIHVRANEFADSIQSDTVGVNYTPAGAQNQYLRIRGVTSDGSDTSNRIAIDDVKNLDFSKVNPVTGPIFIEDAKEGDVVEAAKRVNQLELEDD